MMDDYRKPLKELQRQTARLLKSHRKLALRSLLDWSRDYLADGKYDELNAELGAEGCKEHLQEKLDDLRMSLQSKRTAADLFLGPNHIRSAGNAAAHVFDDDDILDAVEAFPEGEDRKVLEMFLRLRMTKR